MNEELKKKTCLPCEGGLPAISDTKAIEMLEGLSGWERDGMGISKQYQFKDFLESMKFVNAVAELAEAEGHHPDILIHYNSVKMSLWTHAISGLSENDFILATKIEELDRT